MSLATRCTACGTVFRVVQDQLRVSDGWVRCGRCDAVFNASDGLFDLEREAPPAWSPTQPPALPVALAADEVNDADERGPQGWNDPRNQQLGRLQVDVHDTPPVALGSVAPLPDVATAPPADLVSGAPVRPVDDFGVAPTREGAWAASAEGPSDATEPPPDFVDRVGRASFWQRRGTRAALGGATLLLLVMLAGQAAAQFSDIAAARWPPLRPVLAGWCSVAGCSLAAPRRIEELVVDSSALAPVIGTEALKLAVSLHNRAAFAVAVPSVDLSLTDSTGRLIARRTLQPGDFRVVAASLASGADLSLQANISAGAAPVTGYTVEIFYP